MSFTTEQRNNTLILVGILLFVVSSAIDVIASIMVGYIYYNEIIIIVFLLGIFLAVGGGKLERRAKKDPIEERARVERMILRYRQNMLKDIIPKLYEMLKNTDGTDEVFELFSDAVIEANEAKIILETYLSDYPNDLKRVLQTFMDIDLLSALGLRRDHFDYSLWRIDQRNAWEAKASSSSVPEKLSERTYLNNQWLSPLLENAPEGQDIPGYETHNKTAEDVCTALNVDIGEYQIIAKGFKTIFYKELPMMPMGELTGGTLSDIRWVAVIRSKYSQEEIEDYFGSSEEDEPSRFDLGITHLVEQAKVWRGLIVRVTETV